MSVRKNTVRKRLGEYRAAIEAMAERMSDIGFICPYARCSNELGEAEDMLEYDAEGNGTLPHFCSLFWTKDYFGECDVDCTGAKDRKSCWLHYFDVIPKEPRKFRRITKAGKSSVTVIVPSASGQ